MPGIFGIIDTGGQADGNRHSEMTGLLARMADTMRYDASYEVETVVLPEVGAYVGRVGWPVEVHVGGPKGLNSQVVLLTSGEPVIEWTAADNGRRDRATARGNVNGLGLLEAYARCGEDALPRLNGVFAGVLVDRRRRECLLFNDRYGVERIFIHREKDRTFFSSEAKAILAVVPDTRAFDEDGLAQFMAGGCTLGSRSLFRGIEVLGGGTLMRFRTERDAMRRVYFDPVALEEGEPSADVLNGLHERVAIAVRRSVERPPGCGVSLTGGLDSRLIMACLRAAPGSVPCYTFGSMYRETFDVIAGRRVASLCDQPHQVLELGREFLREFEGHLGDAVFIADGYLGVSGAAELYLNRLARTIAPVRVTGNWGGELLRGVRVLKHDVPRGGVLAGHLLRMLGGAEKVRREEATGKRSHTALFHFIGEHGYGRYAVERSQVTMRLPFLDDELVRWLYRVTVSSRRANELCSAVIGREHPALLAIPTDQGLLGTGWEGARLLRRLFRQTVSRAEYWTSHGAPHWLARLGSFGPGSLIEAGFRGRNKFQHFRTWFRGELAGFLREALLGEESAELRPWFDVAGVDRMVREHLAGLANHTNEIDKLLTVKLIFRRLLKTSPA